jgi:hypothetical protein
MRAQARAARDLLRGAKHLSLLLLTGLTAAAASAAAPPVIPWLDQHPPKASTHPPLAAPCRADQLHAHLFLQGATGSLVGGVDLTNAGSSPCSLRGWPRVSFTGAAAATTRSRIKRIARLPVPPDVIADPRGSMRALGPGKSAHVSLVWSNWCGPGSQPAGGSGTPPAGIRIGFASGTSLVVPVAHAPRCDAPEDPSTLSVRPFTPTWRALPRSSRLPLAVAIVGRRPVSVKPGLRAFRIHRGELLRFTVAVTNTGRMPFHFARSSCPVYIEQLLPERPFAYLLNCRPVGSIEPHQTVLFEMQLPIAAGARLGNTGLTWELAPKTYAAPFASAAVRVVRSRGVAAASAATIPYPVFAAVHGRVVGWAKTGSDWFVVYVDGKGGGWCALRGAWWRMALVETTRLPVHVVADRRISGAMCGNELAWVQVGRFSDGRHREVAFMLWTTPAIGAWSYIYRVDGGRFRLLARFGGDRVTLGRGTVTAGFENRGRSPHGEIEDVYRFVGGGYRLVRRR